MQHKYPKLARRTWLPPLLAVALVVLIGGTAEACPSCKQALASSAGGEGDVVQAYFWSILFMLSMPFTILGCFSAYMYLLVRRARRERDASGRPAPRRPAPAATSAEQAAETREAVSV